MSQCVCSSWSQCVHKRRASCEAVSGGCLHLMPGIEHEVFQTQIGSVWVDSLCSLMVQVCPVCCALLLVRSLEHRLLHPRMDGHWAVSTVFPLLHHPSQLHSSTNGKSPHPPQPCQQSMSASSVTLYAAAGTRPAVWCTVATRKCYLRRAMLPTLNELRRQKGRYSQHRWHQRPLVDVLTKVRTVACGQDATYRGL